MQGSERWKNVLLAMMAALLLAVCVMSIARQMSINENRTETEYARNE